VGFEKLTSRIKQSINDYRNEQARKKTAEIEAQARKKATEEARQQKILSGKIEPIQVIVNLEPNEKAYIELSANRMAIIDSIIEKTTGKTKKKGVITRAVVGGVLLGPLGAVAGAATAGSKGSSVKTQETVSKLDKIDQGTLILTNKRLIFLGQNVASLPYDNLIAVSFIDTSIGKKLTVKYEGMLRDEHYIISGDNAEDIELYYKGIKNILTLDNQTTFTNQPTPNSSSKNQLTNRPNTKTLDISYRHNPTKPTSQRRPSSS